MHELPRCESRMWRKIVGTPSSQDIHNKELGEVEAFFFRSTSANDIGDIENNMIWEIHN